MVQGYNAKDLGMGSVLSQETGGIQEGRCLSGSSLLPSIHSRNKWEIHGAQDPLSCHCCQGEPLS